MRHYRPALSLSLFFGAPLPRKNRGERDVDVREHGVEKEEKEREREEGGGSGLFR